MGTLRTRLPAAAALLAAAAITLSACGDDGGTTTATATDLAPSGVSTSALPGGPASSSEATETRTVTAAPGAPAAPGEGGSRPTTPGGHHATPGAPGNTDPVDAPATSGNGKCVDLNSAVVTSALADLGSYTGKYPYVAVQGSPESVGACPDLMWVLTSIEGGTASSPYNVLFFDARGPVGRATQEPSVFTSVVGHSSDAVQVQYKWIKGDEPNCCAAGGPVTVTFTLSGGAVTPDRPVPTEALARG